MSTFVDKGQQASMASIGFYHTKMTVISERTRVAIKRPCINCIKHILAVLMDIEERWVKSLFAKINFIL